MTTPRRRLSSLASQLARWGSGTGPSTLPSGATPAAGAADICSGPLTPAQLREFKDDGFVIVDGLLDTEKHIAPIQRALERKVDAIAAALLQAGVITDAHAALPLRTRMEALARDV